MCVACNATLLSLNENVKKCIHKNANKCNLPIKRLSEAISKRQLLGKERQFFFLRMRPMKCYPLSSIYGPLPIHVLMILSRISGILCICEALN